MDGVLLAYWNRTRLDLVRGPVREHERNVQPPRPAKPIRDRRLLWNDPHRWFRTRFQSHLPDCSGPGDLDRHAVPGYRARTTWRILRAGFVCDRRDDVSRQRL